MIMQLPDVTPRFNIFQACPFCDTMCLIAPYLSALVPHSNLFVLHLWDQPPSLTLFFSDHNNLDCKTERPNKGTAALGRRALLALRAHLCSQPRCKRRG